MPPVPEMAQDAAALTLGGNPMSAKGDGTLGVWWGIALVWPTFLPAARSLVEDLFSLEEPWQGRFLGLVANLATNWAWGGQRPTREEVTAWLGTDISLYQLIKLLLDAWRRPRRFCYYTRMGTDEC